MICAATRSMPMPGMPLTKMKIMPLGGPAVSGEIVDGRTIAAGAILLVVARAALAFGCNGLADKDAEPKEDDATPIGACGMKLHAQAGL